ncbi:MAG: DmsE family decaheme c-type cytochrome [Nitrospirota bacterium]
MKRLLSVLSVLLFFGSAFLGITVFQPTAHGQGQFVGPDTCKGCHEPYYDSYRVSVHGKKAIPNAPANREACESCHGSGTAHVNAGGGKGTIINFDKKTNPDKKAGQCLGCHEESQHLAFWNLSAHQSAGVSCDGCHSAHVGGPKNLKASQPELCLDCHRSTNFQVNKQSHHPIREGKVSCTNCHDPHGTTAPRMVKADSINDLCYKCHMDKRGPFMWDHPPVEENCMICHAVHGSNHLRLLDKKMPEICQSCHDWSRHPGTPYTRADSFQRPYVGGSPSNKLVGRSCLNCHTNVHGSNGPGTNGLRFVR